MESWITISDEPLDATAVLQAVGSPLAGAVLLFSGTTRAVTGERETASLDYECYREMALSEMRKLAEQAVERWPLTGCAIHHRVGHVPIGEASVLIAVSSPHREEAFQAGRWLIDTLKQTVPIWKKENWADGSSDWVHPGMPAASSQSSTANPTLTSSRPANQESHEPSV